MKTSNLRSLFQGRICQSSFSSINEVGGKWQNVDYFDVPAYVLGLFLLSINLSSAQSTCSCSENFDFVVSTVKKNYSGYTYKVTQVNKNKFDRLTDSLRRVATKANSGECLQILYQWTDLLSDPHLGIYLDTKNPNQIRAFFSDTERIHISEKEVKKNLNTQKLDAIEGIWEDSDGNYKVAIIKNPQVKNGFIGFILKADSIYWLPGQVKIKAKKIKNQYATQYFLQDHTLDKTEISIEDTKLTMKGGSGYWNKVYPTPESKPVVLVDDTPGVDTDKPSFKIIDQETILFTIPNFNLRHKPAIDSLVRTNKNLLLTRKNLIIDLRGNTGGGSPTFEALIPLLYTNPIIVYGHRVLSTEENIKRNEKALLTPHIPENIREELRLELQEMKTHPNAMVSFPDDTLILNGTTPYPSRVAILINGNTISAAELFLLRANQSSKVTVFGEPSFGGVYFLDANDLKLPCESIVLRYPTSISNYLEKHKSASPGIEPDVKIPSSTKDWIGYVNEYLKHNP